MHGDAAAILEAVTRAAEPRAAVERSFEEGLEAPTALLATGKGSIAMARAAAASRFGALAGVVTAVPEHAGGAELPAAIEVLACDHPLPTERNVRAADRVEAFARGLGEDDRLLVLISGGGSAHFCAPAEGISLEDLREISSTLMRVGATIDELNAVRKHCERLKGGNLARLAWPAAVDCLVVSDVIGDRLDTISSGPFAPDGTTFADALSVLKMRGVLDRVPAVRDHLLRGSRGEIAETPKAGDACFERVSARIVASNRVAVDAAAGEAERLGYEVLEKRFGHTGPAADIGRELAERAMRHRRERPGVAAAIVVGGETTVDVQRADGVGGRNQEVALAAAIGLEGIEGVTVLSFGTDGIDGPTDAAGAIVDGATAGAMRSGGVNPAGALARHDSHRALDAAEALIRTGPTGTNVNDVAVALVRR